MIYLAAPYGATDPEMVEQRMREVERVLAHLNFHGQVSYSPLLIHHCLKSGYPLPSTMEFWRTLCFSLLSKCDEMVVLCLDGWESSIGIREEIEYCAKANIPVTYRESTDFTLS